MHWMRRAHSGIGACLNVRGAHKWCAGRARVRGTCLDARARTGGALGTLGCTGRAQVVPRAHEGVRGAPKDTRGTLGVHGARGRACMRTREGGQLQARARARGLIQGKFGRGRGSRARTGAVRNSSGGRDLDSRCGMENSNGAVARNLRRNFDHFSQFRLGQLEFSFNFLKLTHINPTPSDPK